MVILFLFVEPVFPIIILWGKDRDKDDRGIYVMHIPVSFVSEYMGKINLALRHKSRI